MKNKKECKHKWLMRISSYSPNIEYHCYYCNEVKIERNVNGYPNWSNNKTK